MPQKIQTSPFDPPRDLRTDYALIATGIAAAVVALVYLIVA